MGDEDYNLYWVAPRFTLAAGGTMNPDLLFLSEVRNHALIVEAKGGTSLNLKQLENAKKVTVTDLVRGAAVHFRDPGSAQFTYLLACFESAKDEIAGRLKDGGHEFPVLSISKGGIALVYGKTADGGLNHRLYKGVELPEGPFPTQFIPFDSGSTLQEVAASVIVHIIKELSRDRPHFQVEEILSAAIPIWNWFHPAEKRQLVSAALRVINRMQKTKGTEFRRVITAAGTPQTPHLYAITHKVPRKGGGHRTIRYETLHGWANKFMESIKGRELPPIKPTPDEGTQRAFWTRSD